MTENVDIRDSPGLEPGPSDSVVAADPEPAKPEPPVATCPNDGDPLVMTFVFSGFEFICLECGRLYGFLEPTPAPATPQLLDRMEQRKAEFRPLAAAILTAGMYRKDCELCTAGEEHAQHVTEDEIRASEDALRKVQMIRDRRRELHGA
jgi:hypothetical protein